MKISNNPVETLVAFAIGAGIGLSIYDPEADMGGILNFIRPYCMGSETGKARQFPYMYADTGIPAFLAALENRGAHNKNLKIVVAGGASSIDPTGGYNIGRKNFQAVKEILAQNNLVITHEDIGGLHRRTLSLEIGSGAGTINVFGRAEKKI
ncbi:MAG: chemotaxis protein CheD [Desulfobacterales bacterium]|nr:MAG: chemotaxis protein CheD [Desulfobacterales bacterium]